MADNNSGGQKPPPKKISASRPKEQPGKRASEPFANKPKPKPTTGDMGPMKNRKQG